MTTEPEIGSRVVMRYKLPPGYAHPMTDVIGELVSLDPRRRSVARTDTWCGSHPIVWLP